MQAQQPGSCLWWAALAGQERVLTTDRNVVTIPALPEHRRPPQRAALVRVNKQPRIFALPQRNSDGAVSPSVIGLNRLSTIIEVRNLTKVPQSAGPARPPTRVVGESCIVLLLTALTAQRCPGNARTHVLRRGEFNGGEKTRFEGYGARMVARNT